MRKTVQEWLCANGNGKGKAKTKFSCRKTAAQIRQSSDGTIEDPFAVAAKEKRTRQKTIRKRKPR